MAVTKEFESLENFKKHIEQYDQYEKIWESMDEYYATRIDSQNSGPFLQITCGVSGETWEEIHELFLNRADVRRFMKIFQDFLDKTK